MTDELCNYEQFVDMDFIARHIEKPWPWRKLSSYHTTFNFFELQERFPDNPNLHWNWRGLSKNRHLNVAILKKHADMPWGFVEMSYNPKLTLEMVRLFPGAAWEWWGVSASPSISLKEVLANPDLPWDWRGVSANPGVTYEQARMHPEVKWDWAAFVKKPGGVESFTEYHVRNAAARRIQAQWRKCVSDPAFLACQRRLEREVYELCQHQS